MTEAAPSVGVGLRVVTYNVHRCRGMDRRVVPERAARVLAALGPDLAGLQEVIGPAPHAPGHIPPIELAVGLDAAFATARSLRGHAFGNLVLSRFRLVHSEQFDLSWRLREPRVLQRVLVDIDGRRVQFYNVHLGTSLRERRTQAKLLGEYIELGQPAKTPTIVVGDFNEWLPGPVALVLRRWFHDAEDVGGVRARRSYPGVLPVVHLDHIYHSPHFVVRRVTLVRTRLAVVASDHLPLMADLVLNG